MLCLVVAKVAKASHDYNAALCRSLSSDTPLCWSADQTDFRGEYRREGLVCGDCDFIPFELNFIP